MLPKLIAHYLPQFHRIPENDAWWGDGFTEWSAVKAAVPLFEGHRQPRVPLDNNYYDLSDIETLKWQAELARKYGIYGLSFYHYWFKDGKQVLEKPAEMLLNDKTIDMPFCFNWANQTWARTWSKLVEDAQNVWAGTFEEKGKKNENKQGILLEQKYGDRKDWIAHIRYLLPFFKDPRYIRLNNRPVFVLFQPDKIYCLSDMMECWNEELKKEGIPGIYLIGESFGQEYFDIPELSAWLMRSPNYSMSAEGKKNIGSLMCYDYDKMWEKLLDYQPDSVLKKKKYLCAMLDYDSTPRKGKNGEVILGVDSSKFKGYFDRLIKKHENLNNEYLFINAWNEWGEGMYLEPDSEHGYDYLESIKYVMDKYSKDAFGVYQNEYVHSGIVDEDEEKNRLKCRLYLVGRERLLLSRWLNIYNVTHRLEEYLLDRGYKNIAVYGLGVSGKNLIGKLSHTRVLVNYVIDRNPSIDYAGLSLYGLEDKWPEIDVVIVTPVARYGDIKESIRKYHSEVRTISLEHIIYELE